MWGREKKDEEDVIVSKVSEESIGVFSSDGDYECGCHRLWPGLQRSTLSGALLLVVIFNVVCLRDI